eukprot:1151606-Pelagomonas_calceolata.AAC.4
MLYNVPPPRAHECSTHDAGGLLWGRSNIQVIARWCLLHGWTVAKSRAAVFAIPKVSGSAISFGTILHEDGHKYKYNDIHGERAAASASPGVSGSAISSNRFIRGRL